MACPEHVIEWEGDGPLITVSCMKCREVAIYGSAEGASAGAIHHAKACGSSRIMMAELLPPDVAPLN